MRARCDFCGRAFLAVIWNERTCVACAAHGAPNQGRSTWESYMESLIGWMSEREGSAETFRKRASSSRLAAERQKTGKSTFSREATLSGQKTVKESSCR